MKDSSAFYRYYKCAECGAITKINLTRWDNRKVCSKCDGIEVSGGVKVYYDINYAIDHLKSIRREINNE